MRRNNAFWGSVLIIIGAISLFNHYYPVWFLRLENFWPLLILAPGLAFELGYFTYGKNPGLLVPGGILVTIGLLFLLETATGWGFSAYTWPIYPLAVAIGLFQLYLFGERHRALLIPVGILGGFSAVAFLTMIFGRLLAWLDFGIILPVALILVGAYVLYHNLDKA